MSGILYLFLSALAMFLWHKNDCAVCVSSFDIGFWGRSWYLWGAVFYAAAAMFAFKYKKNWLVTVVMAGGILFHASLIYSVYTATQQVCRYCIGFLAIESIAMVAYRFERPRPHDHLFAWGPARSAVIMAIVLFLLHPASKINYGEQAFAAVVPESKKTSQAVKKRPDLEISSGAIPEENIRTVLKENGQTVLSVTGQDGTKINLYLNKRPALLFAWWCPHCSEALKNIAKLPPWKRPYPVAVYLQGNNDETNIRQKLKTNGLPDTVYYIYNEIPPVEGVPVLLWFKDGLQTSFDIGFDHLDEIMSGYVNEPKWGYNAVSGGSTLVNTPGAIKYRPITNVDDVLKFLREKDSMMAEKRYLDVLDAAGKKHNVDPILLLAITGQEQAFVPGKWADAEEMLKNPFNVYGSWQVYAPGFSQSVDIAARTVNKLSSGCPTWMNPIQWIDSPDNPNCRYAEDTEWWKGVEYFYTQLKNSSS
jgi:hypothetical protein